MHIQEQSIQANVSAAHLRLEFHPDRDMVSPREDRDNLGTMVCGHRRYSLGDTNGLEAAVSLLKEVYSEWYLETQDLSHIPTVQDLIERSNKAIVLPLYLYDHSGITISTGPFSCPWDSGQVGFVFVPKAQVLTEYGWKKLSAKRTEKITNLLKGEVEEYDQFLRGDVWYFLAYEDGDVVDSCSGFYGDDPKANGMMDYLSPEFQQLVHQGNFSRIYS
ncbi:hypothetical protein ACMHYO_11865 [Allopusillimonas ginsengisoli]|uniref:hypothetical protein n=1 Tax=Allopusillimonas ginsengisoli TaxID=453575 RepID=UPI0039C21E2B